jgi:hypothetical protein
MTAPTVPELIEAAEANIQRLKNHVAAYGAMMRLLEAPEEERSSQAPVFVWPARMGDSPIEIQTDLSSLPPAQIMEMARAVGTVHYQALFDATNKLVESSQALLKCFTTPEPPQPQEQVHEPQVVPGPAPAGGIPPVATGQPAPVLPLGQQVPAQPVPATQPAQPGPGQQLVPPGSVGQPPAGGTPPQ